jgi:hypothetical protein
MPQRVRRLRLFHLLDLAVLALGSCLGGSQCGRAALWPLLLRVRLQVDSASGRADLRSQPGHAVARAHNWAIALLGGPRTSNTVTGTSSNAALQQPRSLGGSWRPPI